jgi:hypothetical protein
VNTEKAKFMLLPHEQNVGQNHDIRTANRCSKMWHSSNIGNDINKSKFYSGGN